MTLQRRFVRTVYLIFNKLLFFLGPAYRHFRKTRLNAYLDEPVRHQPVFIIGAPRSGSTILYQVLTNQLDVLYFNNLICRLYRNIFLGFILTRKFFGERSHNCFRSNFGNTRECGSHAPSECGQFWYQWLPVDRHYIGSEDISEKMVSEIRAEIRLVSNYFKKPLVFKNLNAGQRLKLIYSCFPDARIIVVKRDPLLIAQSILLAKRRLGIRDGTFWGIMPRNVSELREMEPHKQIIQQIYYIEKQIMEDIKLFHNNVLYIDYAEFTAHPEQVIARCQSFIGRPARSNYDSAAIKSSATLKLSADEIKKFQVEIEKLDWSKVGYR